MKRFKFSLESVLKVREKTLVDEQTKLATLLSAVNKQQDKLNENINTLNLFKIKSEEYLQGNNFDPMTISNYAMYGAKLQKEINVQKELIKKMQFSVENQQQRVKEAYIKVKSLENLEEKQKERYLKELQLEEIKEIDDIVNSRRNIA
ncbi:MAG: flagellar export protein FliJ [Candidatus Gastranaerophilales bacterium]|nr:flagellar export protein FliJ [Candidatus Gastranaerophilales bacterium]